MSEKNPNRIAPTPPKTERWVGIMAIAFVPVLAALVVPQAARIPLLSVGGLIFIAGFVLMLRQSRRSRDGESLRQLVHADSE
jgi:hypothetical protein